MEKKFENYKIGETIQRIDGTFNYCVEKLVDPMFGGYVEIFSGTKEECEKHLEEITKEAKKENGKV